MIIAAVSAQVNSSIQSGPRKCVHISPPSKEKFDDPVRGDQVAPGSPIGPGEDLVATKNESNVTQSALVQGSLPGQNNQPYSIQHNSTQVGLGQIPAITQNSQPSSGQETANQDAHDKEVARDTIPSLLEGDQSNLTKPSQAGTPSVQISPLNLQSNEQLGSARTSDQIIVKNKDLIPPIQVNQNNTDSQAETVRHLCPEITPKIVSHTTTENANQTNSTQNATAKQSGVSITAVPSSNVGGNDTISNAGLKVGDACSTEGTMTCYDKREGYFRCVNGEIFAQPCQANTYCFYINKEKTAANCGWKNTPDV